MAEASVFERIGGVNAIELVVDRFCDELVKNPKLNVSVDWPQFHAEL